MPLKNFHRTKTTKFGRDTWKLTTIGGASVEAFDYYCETLIDHPLSTRKRYAEALSRFLDYLAEAGAFASNGVTPKHLNDIIEAYPLLLRDGSADLARRMEQRGVSEQERWLADAVRALNWKPLSPNSIANTLAPVNGFLKRFELIAREDWERNRLLGPQRDAHYSDGLIRALAGHEQVPINEVVRMRNNTLLGSVAKFSNQGIRRARRLTPPAGQQQEDRRLLDFPRACLEALTDAATCERDRALWLLLAASGIRSSEARNLLLQDIDFEAQKVYVMDPHRRRFALPKALAGEPRFKGRAIASTYLFPPLRQKFFTALGRYLEREFIPTHQPGRGQYLFQYVEPARRGQPLVNASDSAMNKPFKNACRRANVPLPGTERQWTLHSLRHLYGVYMLNDYPVSTYPGKTGLPLTDVQLLMGHQSSRTTERYARPKVERLLAQLRAADEAQLGVSSEEMEMLPPPVTKSLTGLA